MTTKIATILIIEEEIEMTEGMAATETITDDIETMIDVVTITAMIKTEEPDRESSTKILWEELDLMIDLDPENIEEGMIIETTEMVEPDQGFKGIETIKETIIEKSMVPLRRDMITNHNIEDHKIIIKITKAIKVSANQTEDVTIIDIIAIEGTIETKIDAIIDRTIMVEIETMITVTITATETNIDPIDRTTKLQTIIRKIQEMT
jgi:hypothetical protein